MFAVMKDGRRLQVDVTGCDESEFKPLISTVNMMDEVKQFIL